MPSCAPLSRSLLMTIVMYALRQSQALVSRPAFFQRFAPLQRSARLFSSRGSDIQTDEYGRIVRKRPGRGDDRNDESRNSDWKSSESRPSRRPAGRSGGWDDDDDDDFIVGGWDDLDQPSQRNTGTGNPRPNQNNNRGGERGRGRGKFSNNRGSQSNRYNDFERNNNNRNNNRNFERRDNDRGPNTIQRDQGKKKGRDAPKVRQINLIALEGAGFIHLYGLSSVLNALQAGRRDISSPEEDLLPGIEPDNDFGYSEVDDNGESLPERKPEAQFRPWLFVQSKSTELSERSASKANAAAEVERLAEENGVPIAQVDKGVLNSLSGNRPHQGYVLRCGKMDFESITKIPHPSEDPSAPSLWLVLDEVVDPQNLGALIRSAFFLGGEKIGILVCSKNSAPPSPVVSAASAGALEIANIFSTSNLPRTLTYANEAGFRIVGASSSVPSSKSSVYDLQDLPSPGQEGDDRPVLLVLGSEGHGLRKLVAAGCNEFVRLPAGTTSDDDESSVGGVDSLNVSVTGGILLWHMIHGGRTNK